MKGENPTTEEVRVFLKSDNERHVDRVSQRKAGLLKLLNVENLRDAVGKILEMEDKKRMIVRVTEHPGINIILEMAVLRPDGTPVSRTTSFGLSSENFNFLDNPAQ